MEIEPAAGGGALPQPEPELDAEVITKGEFGQPIGLIEFDFQGYRLSDSEQHLAAIEYLIRAGVALRENSYAKYLNEPLVTDVPVDQTSIRTDVRLCGYGLGNYSVEDGSIKIKTLLLIGISFQVLNFGYDAISKYPNFKVGLNQISEEISAHFDDLEALFPRMDHKDRDGVPPYEAPTVTFVASRQEDIYEAVRKRSEAE